MTDAVWSDGDAIREWLINERRLGVRHVDLSSAFTGGLAEAPGEITSDAPTLNRAAAMRSELQRPSVEPPEPVFAPVIPAAPAFSAGAPSMAADARPARSNGPRSLPVAVLDPYVGQDAAAWPAICNQDLSEAAAQAALDELNRQVVTGCRRCGLHAGRTQTVFGVGRPRPDLVFIGEGPGADEDARGEPFVGRAGQLLTRMIAAMTLTREQVYICNMVKCRPPGNRTPFDEEMHLCSPILIRQLAILRPKVIVALGRPAAQSLLASTAPISQLRGRFHEFPPPHVSGLDLPKVPLMPTFHPAYLLRSPNEKAKAWEDLKQVMALLGLSPRAA